MKALITGIDGFVGYYLQDHILKQGQEVYGTTILDTYQNDKIKVSKMNLLDPKEVNRVISEIQPDCIYHLAGQSAVGLSWSKPALTISINVNGTINLLEAVKAHCKKAKVLIIGSSDQYGTVKEKDCPITEDQPLNPVSPYGISKCTQEQIAKLYVKSYDMNIIMVRAFNHIGPGQGQGFVVADFASKVADIEKGAEPVITVGNLEAYRDFTDVRDVVRGYSLLMEKGRIGEVYNIGSGKPIKIREVLEKLISLSSVDIEVKLDADKLRPSDVPLVVCDNTKIRSHIGWDIAKNIHQTLKDTLDYWRSI